MNPTTAAYSRDGNGVPITTNGIIITKSQTLAGNNTTVATPLFRVTGTVLVKALYGVVTTLLGSNVTAAYWRLNDQSAQLDISLASGSTISNFPSGSMLYRKGLAATNLQTKASSVGALIDPTTAGAGIFSEFAVTQKAGGINTDIEFVYTTTNTPTSGVIKHYIGWIPLSDDGNLIAV